MPLNAKFVIDADVNDYLATLALGCRWLTSHFEIANQL